MKDDYYHNLLRRYYEYTINNPTEYLKIGKNMKNFTKWYEDMKEMSEKYISEVFHRYLGNENLFKSKTIEEFDLNLSLRGYS